MTVGSPGLVAQSVQTAALVTLHPLVSDGARYAVMAAQLSHRKIIAPQSSIKRKRSSLTSHSFQGIACQFAPKCSRCARYTLYSMCPVYTLDTARTSACATNGLCGLFVAQSFGWI